MASPFSRLAVLSAAIVAAAGCDHFSGFQSTLALRPAPSFACADSAIGASPVVSHMQVRRADWNQDSLPMHQADVSVRLNAARKITGTFGLKRLADSTALARLDLIWRGRMRAFPDSERVQMARDASPILSPFQRVCAPSDTADSVSCVLLDDRTSCGSGAT